MFRRLLLLLVMLFIIATAVSAVNESNLNVMLFYDTQLYQGNLEAVGFLVENNGSINLTNITVDFSEILSEQNESLNLSKSSFVEKFCFPSRSQLGKLILKVLPEPTLDATMISPPISLIVE